METPRQPVLLGQRGTVEAQLAHLGDEVAGKGLILGVLLDDGEHFGIDELAGGLADQPLLVREQALKAHIVGDVREGGIGTGHGNLLCPEASGGWRKL